MGMFDEIRCDRPLPMDGFEDELFQTKSLDCCMDLYCIRADGSLWVERYDTEDRSDPNAEGLLALAGCMTRVNKRWEALDGFTGEIQFYTSIGDNIPGKQRCGLVSFSAYFRDGELKELNLVNHREPENLHVHDSA